MPERFQVRVSICENPAGTIILKHSCWVGRHDMRQNNDKHDGTWRSILRLASFSKSCSKTIIPSLCFHRAHVLLKYWVDHHGHDSCRRLAAQFASTAALRQITGQSYASATLPGVAVGVCTCVCVCVPISGVSVCLFACLCLCLCLCLSVSASVCLSVPAPVSASMSVCACVWLYVSVCVSVCLFVCLCLCLCLSVSASGSMSLSLFLSFCRA